MRLINQLDPIQSVEESPDEILTLGCQNDLETFVEFAWPTVVRAAKFQNNWHIGAICEHLTALYKLDFKNLLINVPPRFGKSVISSVMFPAWLWLQDPKLRMLYSSYSQPLATRDSLYTRQLIQSPWYQGQWADRFTIAGDQNEKMRFENTDKGYRLATSVAGANTGEGGDLIVCDDPHNVAEAESDLKREEAVRWWNEVMSTRGNDPRTARRVVIAQRAHFADLSQDILDKGEYVHLNLAMEFEKGAKLISVPSGVQWLPTEVDERVEDGELLWPARYDTAWVAAQKIAMGSYAYAAQFQQRPTPRTGGMFSRDKIVIDTLPLELRLEKGWDDAVWSWDMSFKDLADSDYVVGQCWIRKGGMFYLIHQTRARMAFSATKAAVRTTRAKFTRITRILVEDKANGTAVIDDLRTTIPGLTPVEPMGGKESRASTVEPLWESGCIVLPMGAPWVEDFIQECAEFPRGAYDDQVDAMSQALVWLLNRYNMPGGASVGSFTKSTLPWQRGPQQGYKDPRGE